MARSPGKILAASRGMASVPAGRQDFGDVPSRCLILTCDASGDQPRQKCKRCPATKRSARFTIRSKQFPATIRSTPSPARRTAVAPWLSPRWAASRAVWLAGLWLAPQLTCWGWLSFQMASERVEKREREREEGRERWSERVRERWGERVRERWGERVRERRRGRERGGEKGGERGRERERDGSQ